MSCKSESGRIFECDVFFRGADKGISKGANDFARAILMPEKQFRADIRGGMGDIGELSDKYKVSSIAIRIRAKELGFRGHGP